MLDVHLDYQGPSLTVHLTGELDMATAPKLLADVARAADVPLAEVRVEVSGLEFCDSTGLRAFLSLRDRLAAAGAALVLTDPPPALVRLLEVTGVGEVLHVA